MEKITEEELKEILEQHKLWLDSDGKDGKCAILYGADLSGADLRCANLTRADLRCANLTDANLSGANLTRADLYGADLTGTYLTFADLTRADLTRADLIRANLTRADLTGTYLTRADLTDTILDDVEQCRKGIVLTEPMTVYKKAYEDKIITIEIPIGAKVFSINNNKRRANKVNVIDMQGEAELSSWYNTDFKYHIGDEIEITNFDERYNVECSTGIHFFLTREEAEEYIY